MIRSSLLLAPVAALGLALAAPAPAQAAPPPVLVVSPTGDDTAAGGWRTPLGTIQHAVDLATPGTTILLRGGTYPLTENVQILSSGTRDAPITLTAVPGERVLIEGEELPYTPAPLGGSIPRPDRGAIHMEASWWRISNLEIAHGPYALYCNNCNHNVFDRLVTRDNYESGFQLQGLSGDNLILNLDAYGNHDPRKNGESADGLAIKEGSGTGNVVRGARLWNNVDDGFDAYLFTSPITVEDTVAYGNGVNRWDFPDFAGDGNGFKLGGGPDPDPAADHVVRNSIAFDNTAHGFTDNGNPGVIRIERSTAWRNARTGFDVDSSSSVLTRDLAVSNRAPVALGAASASTRSSWDLGDWSDADLRSTDPATLTGPRTLSGSIRRTTFLVPKRFVDVGARL
jgi:hypothetical protein